MGGKGRYDVCSCYLHSFRSAKRATFCSGAAELVTAFHERHEAVLGTENASSDSGSEYTPPTNDSHSNHPTYIPTPLDHHDTEDGGIESDV